MHRRTLAAAPTVVLSLIALIALSADPALAATGGTDRPYRASGTATSSLDVSTFKFRIQGTANVAHLGRSTSLSTGSLTGGTLGCTSSSYTSTLTAANGDTVTSESESTSCPVEGTNEFTIVSSDTITGGTGRFAGATGSATTTGIATPDPSKSSAGTLVFDDTFTSSGTISY
jgi:hypothetical protein